MELTKAIDGKNYRYLKLGSGQKKMLILWGFASYKENATKLVDKNFPDYTVVIPEYPHHNNFEDACLDDITIPALADYFRVLLQHLDFTDFDAIGFSLGGLVLLELLKNHKDFSTTKAVIWASPVLGYDGVSDLPIQLANVYTKLPVDTLEIVHQNKLLQKVLLTRGIKVFAPDQVKKYLAMFKSCRLADLEAKTHCLFVYDPADALVSIKNIHHVKKKINHDNVELVEVRGGGHFGTKAGWDKVLIKIKEFLAE